ncbi:MAG: flagellar hook-basal body protein [Candidatus Hydrogenedentota bacterium]
MIAGLYSAANGLVALHESQAATANNIANAATNGFKRTQPVQQGFYEVFSNTMRQPGAFDMERAPGGGVKVAETYASMRAGPLHTTGNPLDVGLEGPGFIAVDTAGGERFTRDGAFSIDGDGELATAAGHKVQNVGGGHLDVRGGIVIIGADGTVHVDGVPAGQIRMLEFENPQGLRQEGDNLYRAPEPVLDASARAANTRTLQSQLEGSNVNLSQEMTNLMLGMRAYEANQRSVRAADETISQLIEKVGVPR